MFRRILAPLDGTKRAEEAIPFARELASSPDAQIFLLHVEPPAAAVIDEIAIDNRMEAIAAELRAAGVKAHIVTEFGKAAPVRGYHRPGARAAQLARRVAPTQRDHERACANRRASAHRAAECP